ncbi:7716_t:CDS:2 [Acaulospora morrowiae]|uniref:7716_t:CDS:1 n=1 Tax=Acaulospora morrowiae TaxID=94023 RepID=A0A9N9FX66_9GLOM|nr:7716_t:CDS:2 [Acaulospora morrowiae]
MSPSIVIPLTHALISEFLESNKYYNTLNEFRKEAKEGLEDKNKIQLDRPLLSIIQDYVKKEAERLVSNERKIDEDLYSSKDTSYPRYICETFSQIHNSNILTINLQNVASSSYVDNDYETTFSPTIITGSADKTIKFTSLLTGDTFNTFDYHKGGVLAIDFHPVRSNIMLSASMDGSCALTDVSTMDVKQAFKDHQKPVVRAKFSPDGSMIVTAGYDHSLNFYKMDGSSNGSGANIFSPTTPHNSSNLLSPATPSTPLPLYSKVHTITFDSKIESLCFLPNSSFLIVGIRESCYLHYINLQQDLFEITKYNMNLNGDDWVSFTAMDIVPSPNNDGKYLLVSTDDENGRIILYKTFGDATNATTNGNGVNHSSTTLIQIANFYDEFITFSDDSYSSTLSRKLTNPRLLWHPSGNFFYSYGVDSIIRVYSLRTKKLVDQVKGHNDVVRGMWYDEDRDLLVTCGFDKSAKVWCSDELSSRELIKGLRSEEEEKIMMLGSRRNTIV